MRKGRDGEWKKKMEKKWKKMENNGENSCPLTSLPVDRLTATDCNADRSCQKWKIPLRGGGLATCYFMIATCYYLQLASTWYHSGTPEPSG